MNKAVLTLDVQDFINKNLNTDAAKIALAKSPFHEVSSAELASQIRAKKKSEKKLPTWFNTPCIFYPASLSIEQTSSEITARYKASIVSGDTLIDITGGFGVDAYYFSAQNKEVIHCEINKELSELAHHNAQELQARNIVFLNKDGIEFVKQESVHWDTIYVDPARRGSTGKVFRLADCTPNVPEHLESLFAKANRIILKTSPLLDIDAGLKELNHVKEVYVISIKNECKELLWIMESGFNGDLKIVATTLNNHTKSFSFYKKELKHLSSFAEKIIIGLYLYEPDAAILKAGVQDSIASLYHLNKLNTNTQLFISKELETDFPGRIFEIIKVMDTKEIKKKLNLQGNVVVRNYPAKAEELIKKYAIKPTKEQFLIFCKTQYEKNIAIEAKIIQYY